LLQKREKEIEEKKKKSEYYDSKEQVLKDISSNEFKKSIFI
jgi:hypothetical protein